MWDIKEARGSLCVGLAVPFQFIFVRRTMYSALLYSFSTIEVLEQKYDAKFQLF